MNKLEEKIKKIQEHIVEQRSSTQKKILISEMKKIGIEKLPYSYSALKPFIDSETMKFHYSKHYKGYVDKLNKALSKKNYGDLELEKIIKNISKYDETIRNNAGGAFNHALFWNMLSPKSQELKGELLKKITTEFGTFNNFKKKFETTAKDRFGSGWIWLVLTKKNKLKIISTPNQDNPLMNIIKDGGFPLLGLDLWEHAYYLKYKNKRDEYIKNFWKVVNWDFVSKMFEMKTKTKLIESRMNKTIIKEYVEKPYIQSCSFKEERVFQDLLKDSEIGLIYGTGIHNALKTVPWLEFKPKNLSVNRMQGYYKNNERHNLSYLAGNYRAFCMIAKSVNNLLIQTGQEPLNFVDTTIEEIKNSVTRLVNIITINSSKIFEESSPFYRAIMSNLGGSILKGEKIEKLTKERLINKFGENNVEIVSGFGYQTDSNGNDGKITINGITQSLQIKPFSKGIIENNNFIVITSGTLKNYNQDLMVFTNFKETLIFKNTNTKMRLHAYEFPVEDLIYTLR